MLRHLLVSGALALGSTVAHARVSIAQVCVPDSTESHHKPYLGIETTGYKGALERNGIWFHDVRTYSADTDSVRFSLRRALVKPAVRYESIEPATLGGRSTVYVGWRARCGEFINAQGRRLWPEMFSAVRGARALRQAEARDSVWLEVTQHDSLGDGIRYVIASRNRVIARSPRLYRKSYNQSLAPFTLLPENIVVVSSRDTSGVGAIDATTLEERLAPIWQGVGGLAHVAGGQLANPYLLTDDGTQLRVFRTDGTPIDVPRFHRVEAIEGWSRLNWRGAFTRIYALSDTISGTCRIFYGNMTPIVEETMRTSRDWDWKCQRLTALLSCDSIEHLVFTDVAGMTQSYRVTGQSITRVAHNVPGNAVYVFRHGAMITKQVDAAGVATFRTLQPDGTPIAGATFSDVRVLGCGFVHAQRDGRWYTPYADGSVSAQIRIPVFC